MIKRLQIIFLVLVGLLVVIGIGLVIFIKTLDINRFKEQITSQLSKSIGREVTIGKIGFDFSLAKGAVLHLSALSVMDHPDFSTSPMLYIDSSHLNVDILAFIQRKQLLISNIELNSMRINVICNADGEYNVQKIIKESHEREERVRAQNKTSTVKTAAKENDPDRNDNGEFALGDMLIRSVQITDGTLIYADLSGDMPTTVPLSQIDVDVSNVSFGAAFPVTVKASLWSERQNIKVKGLVQINRELGQVRIDDLKMDSDLSELNITEMRNNIPAVAQLELSDQVGGVVVFDGHQILLGKEGLLVLSSEGRLTDGEANLGQFPLPIQKLNMHFDLSERDAELKELAMPVALGMLNISGRVIEYLSEQTFSSDIQLKDAQLGNLSAQFDFPVQIEGKVLGKLKASGQGFQSDAVKKNLIGEGSLSVSDGRVVDVNILKLVLNKISFVPNLVSRIEQNLPERYKEKLKQKDTNLEKVEVQLSLGGEKIQIPRAEINADGFLVIASGLVDFEQNCAFNADFYIPEDLSARLIEVAPELQYLLDDLKRIHIPLRPYKGKIENFRMYPDVEDVGKQVIQSRGKDELRKVIFKALDLEEETAVPDAPPSDPNAPPVQPQTQPAEKKVRPEEAIIENILDLIPEF